MKTICFLGHGQMGKDTCGEMWQEITGMKFAGTTSLYLAQHMGQVLGIPAEEAYARRRESDEMRQLWYDEANKLREGDPTKLARMALAVGPVTGGLRALEEIVGCKRENLFSLIIWVRDPRKPEDDPTMMFGPEHADFILLNDGTKEDLKRKLARLAAFSGLGVTS